MCLCFFFSKIASLNAITITYWTQSHEIIENVRVFWFFVLESRFLRSVLKSKLTEKDITLSGQQFSNHLIHLVHCWCSSFIWETTQIITENWISILNLHHDHDLSYHCYVFDFLLTKCKKDLILKWKIFSLFFNTKKKNTMIEQIFFIEIDSTTIAWLLFFFYQK